VGELLDRIDSRELTEWEAYEAVAGPLGPARLDALFAQLMSVLANVNRSRRQRPYTAEQFMPQWDAEAPKQRRPEMSGEEMLRAAKRMTAADTARRG
jgi:hypothetical protein